MKKTKDVFTPTQTNTLKEQTSNFFKKNMAPNKEEGNNYKNSLNQIKKNFVEKAKESLKTIKNKTAKLKEDVIKGINKFVEKVVNIVFKKDKNEVVKLEKELGMIKENKEKEEQYVFNETQSELLTMYGTIFDIIIESIPAEEKKKAKNFFKKINKQKDKAINDFVKQEHSEINLIV